MIDPDEFVNPGPNPKFLSKLKPNRVKKIARPIPTNIAKPFELDPRHKIQAPTNTGIKDHSLVPQKNSVVPITAKPPQESNPAKPGR